MNNQLLVDHEDFSVPHHIDVEYESNEYLAEKEIFRDCTVYGYNCERRDVLVKIGSSCYARVINRDGIWVVVLKLRVNTRDTLSIIMGDLKYPINNVHVHMVD